MSMSTTYLATRAFGELDHHPSRCCCRLRRLQVDRLRLLRPVAAHAHVAVAVAVAVAVVAVAVAAAAADGP